MRRATLRQCSPDPSSEYDVAISSYNELVSTIESFRADPKYGGDGTRIDLA
jgi:hypothetical protein